MTSHRALDSFLAGEDAIRVVRPPEPKKHLRHDLYAPKPEPEGNVFQRMLGSEYFVEPKPEKPVAAWTTKMYMVGELAKVLGRKGVTIRMWEDRGYIPEAKHYSAGQDKARKRLYTQQQVFGLLSICSDLGMIENKRTPIGEEFIRRVQELWDESE
jgi:hypothetical protein